MRLFAVGVVTVAAACTAELQATTPSASAPEGDVSANDPGAPRPNDGGLDVLHEGAGDAASDAASSPSTPGDLLGTLAGACGLVKSELTKGAPSFEQNTVTFVAGETYDKASLSLDGQRLFDTPNAGGSSLESEVMSFEVLHACEGATLLKTETEIAYDDDDAGPASITDLLVEVDGKKVGVSVTRAYRPQSIPFPDGDVKSLLEKKLAGVNRSTQRVRAEDRWVKQILHVFAADEAQADAVARVLPTIDSALRADTIVLLTKTKGGGFVYCNPDPPLGSECP